MPKRVKCKSVKLTKGMKNMHMEKHQTRWKKTHKQNISHSWTGRINSVRLTKEIHKFNTSLTKILTLLFTVTEKAILKSTWAHRTANDQNNIRKEREARVIVKNYISFFT